MNSIIRPSSLFRPAGALALLAALSLAAPGFGASFHVVTVRGTITQQNGTWDSSVVVGTPFIATLQIDPTARDTSASPTLGVYSSPASPATLAVGNYAFSTSGTKVEIQLGPVETGYEFETENEFTVRGFERVKMHVSLESTNLSLLANDRMPLQAIPLTSFGEKKRFRFEAANGRIEGVITSYTLDEMTGPAAPITKRLINISTRGKVELGDDRLIAGFVIRGSETKRVLVRVLGPSLGAFGVRTPLANPRVEVFSGAVKLGENDDWQTTQAADITATGLAPSNASESAVILDLPEGVYTAVISGVNNGVGTALVEVYEL